MNYRRTAEIKIEKEEKKQLKANNIEFEGHTYTHNRTNLETGVKYYNCIHKRKTRNGVQVI